MMDKDLINTYAYGNLHKELLIQLFAQLLHLQKELHNPERMPDSAFDGEYWAKIRFEALRDAVVGNLQTLNCPNQPEAEIRQASATAARLFFDELRSRLLKAESPDEER